MGLPLYEIQWFLSQLEGTSSDHDPRRTLLALAGRLLEKPLNSIREGIFIEKIQALH